jgi:hypothetical protein
MIEDEPFAHHCLANFADQLQQRIVNQQLAVPDVLRQRRVRGVACRLANAPRCNPGLSRRGSQPSPQGLSAELLGVVSSLGDPLAHHEADTFGGQSLGRYMPMSINAAEDRAILDPGSFQPSFERGEGTPLRPPEGHPDGLPNGVLIGLRFS